MKLDANTPVIDRYACLVADIFGIGPDNIARAENLIATIDAVIVERLGDSRAGLALQMKYGLRDELPATYETIGQRRPGTRVQCILLSKKH
jgi:hypothetical protein